MLERDPEAGALCLVQAKFMDLAAEHVAQMRLADPGMADRVRLAEGDITRPDLGLDGDDARRARQAAVIWHLAAAYDLSVSREMGLEVNLKGTRHVLDLASHCPDLHRLHYVSTCYVSGRYSGVFAEEDLEKGQQFHNYYEETKFLAEVEVRAAARGGLPATVYRPAIVVGDSQTGETQKYDGPYYIIRWVLRQPGTALVPVVGDPDAARVNLVPSDFVIDAITHLSVLPHAAGRTYHLADPDPPTVSRVLETIEQATGKKVRTVPLPRRTVKWAIDRIPGVHRLTGVPSAAVDYFAHPTHYSTHQTVTDLAGSGAVVPAFDAYVDRLLQFMRQHPEVGSSGMA